ncbi:MAG: acetamidase/formamidase family protein [Actinomycetota bacterium]|nr:acetamidase/formamidase family protein [Actinomycetota bacterium]
MQDLAMAGGVHVPAAQSHVAWDNALPPAVVVAPGDELELDLIDASGGQITPTDDALAVGRLNFAAVNPCTGPVYVDGAQPGDDLVVTILDIATGGWGWTANIPGFGLLAEDFPDPHLRVSTISAGMVAFGPGIQIPIKPMIGTIGVAPEMLGQTPLLVPTEAGGNMDIPQLQAGAQLHLPVRVQGALLSAGDTHAVQGDGEVCGTGVETSATVRLRVDVVPGAATATPWYVHPCSSAPQSWAATTGIGPDLFHAAREATRRAVDLVSAHAGLEPVDSYLLLSLVGELRVSEIVDAPNWVVSMHIPASYLRLH